MGYDSISAQNLAKNYAIKMGNTTNWTEDKSITGTKQFAEQLGTSLGQLDARTG